jgi:hypothetical protein
MRNACAFLAAMKAHGAVVFLLSTTLLGLSRAADDQVPQVSPFAIRDEAEFFSLLQLDRPELAGVKHTVATHQWTAAQEAWTLPLKNRTLCDTLGLGWFWTPRENEGAMKSVEEVTAMLELCHKRRANYLLNVGPDDTGRLPDDAVKRLREIRTRLALPHPGPHQP